jgi:hypothetical protein
VKSRRNPVAVRLYRRALWVLPRDFRRERGDAMASMFSDEWRERRSVGRIGLVVRSALDLMVTAVMTRTGGVPALSGKRRKTMRWTELDSDLKVALRSLARSPVFTAAAVLSLALGAGGAATVYGLADRLLLRPIDGVRDPGTLIEIVPATISFPAYRDLAAGVSALEGLAAHRIRSVSLEPGPGLDPRPVDVGIVSGNYFGLLSEGC